MDDAVQTDGVVDVALSILGVPVQVECQDIAWDHGAKRRAEAIGDHAIRADLDAQVAGNAYAETLAVEHAGTSTKIEFQIAYMAALVEVFRKKVTKQQRFYRQNQRFVAGGPELLQLLGFDDDVPVGRMFIAANDGIAFDGAVLGTVLGVANALAAIGVQEMEVGSGVAANGRVGFDWDAHQVEAEQAGPTVPTPGGKALASAGEGPINQIILWDPATGEQLQ